MADEQRTMADDFAEGKPAQALTFGQKAVGLTFNPSGDPSVVKCKQGFADLIDQMNMLLLASNGPGQARHAVLAITDLETAQMRAVKALTWKD